MAFCTVCGSELSKGARFCSTCGAAVQGAAPSPDIGVDRSAQAPSERGATAPIATPSRGGMSLVLPVVVGIAVLIIAYLLLTGRSSEQMPVAGQDAAGARVANDAGTAPAATGTRAADAASDRAAGPSRAPATVSAAMLDSAFASDPRSAAQRYAGPIRVSGVIATMVQPGSTPALSMEGRTRFNYMVVNFPAGYRERLAPLAKGQLIDVTCNDVQSLGGTTILSGCALA